MPAPDITIVLCTHNRADLLRPALASLGGLETAGRFTYEVLVVDNASTDDTPAVIAAAALAAPGVLRSVYEPQKGIVAARNRGLAEARGRWIAFFDDDQLAHPRWLAELWSAAREKQCRVVGGAVQLKLLVDCRPALHPTVRMLLGETPPIAQPKPYGGRLIPGCGNLLLERSVFDEVGVFRTTQGGRGEDTDLFVRIETAGIPAWFWPAAIVQHLTPPARLQPSYLLRLARPIGEGVALRQAALLPRWRLALRWVAKAARAALVYMPAWLAAAVLGRQETTLGLRCRLEIERGYLRRGWSCLFARPGTDRCPQPNRQRTVVAAPAGPAPVAARS